MDGEPLFPGDSDLDQLYRIQAMLGAVTPEQQELFNRNPVNAGIAFNIKDPLTLAVRYEGTMNEVELDFMGRLLTADPAKRMDGAEALRHPYLRDLWEAEQAKGEYTGGGSLLQQLRTPPTPRSPLLPEAAGTEEGAAGVDPGGVPEPGDAGSSPSLLPEGSEDAF